jgi:5-formyltetrahydrofolate cyclo-ligase
MTPPTTSATDKPALRARVRAMRDAFHAAAAPELTPPAPFLALLRAGLTVSAYIPVGSEADPAPLARAALAAGCRIALPHVTTRAAPMRFLSWDPAADLHPGPFGLRQPHAESPALVPDIILTPLLAFDAKLDRLGQGAGYYDRAFAAYPEAYRIGVAWSVQQVDTLPTDAWDMPLHAIITECGWIARPMETAK